jgi:hypothetical protein
MYFAHSFITTLSLKFGTAQLQQLPYQQQQFTEGSQGVEHMFLSAWYVSCVTHSVFDCSLMFLPEFNLHRNPLLLTSFLMYKSITAHPEHTVFSVTHTVCCFYLAQFPGA